MAYIYPPYPINFCINNRENWAKFCAQREFIAFFSFYKILYFCIGKTHGEKCKIFLKLDLILENVKSYK